MRIIGKVVAGIFFVLFFLLFLLLSTVRFELLNKSFVFSSFQRSHVYTLLSGQLAKALPNDPNLPTQERGDYAKIITAIPPEKIQTILQQNLSNVFDYVNGESSDISIFISPSQLGLPGGATISWSLAKAPLSLQQSAHMLYGAGNILLMALAVCLLVLIVLFIFSGRGVLLIAGMLLLILGIAAKVFLYVIIFNTPAHEPAQVLLVLLSKSLLSDVVISWIGLGSILCLTWLALKFRKRK